MVNIPKKYNLKSFLKTLLKQRPVSNLKKKYIFMKIKKFIEF